MSVGLMIDADSFMAIRLLSSLRVAPSANIMLIISCAWRLAEMSGGILLEKGNILQFKLSHLLGVISRSFDGVLAHLQEIECHQC